MDQNSNSSKGNVLIIGGGIAGIFAALDLADQGQFVYLVERLPTIGGKMAQLDKTFPTLDCSICILAPKMVECGRHPRIKLLTYSEVKNVIPIQNGTAFKVKILSKPRYIDVNKCTNCGLCAQNCPVRVPSEFDANVGLRGAAYISFQQAVPSLHLIDSDNCLYFNYGICRICEKICPPKAIDFDQKPQELEVEVASIIIATGFDLIDNSALLKYGYGKYPNIVTSMEYERIMCASGPTRGEIIRFHDRKHPHKIGFILCVGSRNVGSKPYCSKICCMYSTKEAIMTMEHAPDSEILVFFNDLRTIGKNHNEFIERAKSEYNVQYIKGLPNEINEDPETKNLVITYTDFETGSVKFETVEMVVLFPAVIPSKGLDELCNMLGVEKDEYGFVKPIALANNIETSIPGIYVCGCAHGPEDISTSVSEASGAASRAVSRTSIVKIDKKEEKIIEKEIKKGDPLRIGVFICHCGSNIAGFVDVERIAEEIKSVPDVAYVERNLYTCSEESQNSIIAAIEKHNLNRVVIASCSPRTHLPLFQSTCQKAGLNKYLVVFASIRELVSWVHMNEYEKATEKAKKHILMTIAKARLVEPLFDVEVKVIPASLVIGGGISGMTAALTIAKKGFKVFLVEKKEKLGGLVYDLNTIDFNGNSPEQLITPIIQEINKNPNIKILTSSTIKSVNGSIGNFQIIVEHNGEEKEIDVGTIIVAVGGKEFKPHGYYLYKENANVHTNLEFEILIKNNQLQNIKSLAFIQCVGSRESEGRTYCSLTCCAESIKNAILLKKKFPESQIFILFRDIRVFFDEEINYRTARELGINFIRYKPEKPPKLEHIDNKLTLTVFDNLTNMEFELTLDKIVLATPLITQEENKILSEMLKIPIDSNGFFLEAHPKLRPVDFATDGIFVCGTAQSPKNINESISQALGAASRALIPLMNGKAVVEGATAVINEDLCIGCGQCRKICPFNAIEMITVKKKVGIIEILVNQSRVITQLCKGCGKCAPTCPVQAITARHFTNSQIMAMIEACTSFLK
ncbi:MAG: 4Fe-4S binding protein [Candidatus Helarchaeota archaeon]